MTQYQTAKSYASGNKTSVPSPPCGGGSEGASLGIYAKYCPIGHQSHSTDVQKYERYALQSAARSSLPYERVGKCLRVPTAPTVDIHKTLTTGTFHYFNLQTCGSVWHCPCCAAKISEKRKNEVQHGITTHQGNGGEVLLLTLTIPHRYNQSLFVVLEALLKAHRAFEKNRTYSAGFKLKTGLIGRIRGLEVTYGANGWHPHLHLLLFTDRIDKIKELELDLLHLWQKVVMKQGFPEPNHHGLTLENGDKAARYVGKWGLEHEVTKSHIKRSKEGFTPFDLLRVIVGTYTGKGSNVDIFDAVELFREYGKTFKGRRQLVWSNGLRERFDLGKEITDEEIADQVDEQSVLFCKIPLSVWKFILSKEKRGEILSVCSQGHDAFYDYIVQLMETSGEIGDS